MWSDYRLSAAAASVRCLATDACPAIGVQHLAGHHLDRICRKISHCLPRRAPVEWKTPLVEKPFLTNGFRAAVNRGTRA
jgi:hypothetical protein